MCLCKSQWSLDWVCVVPIQKWRSHVCMWCLTQSRCESFSLTHCWERTAMLGDAHTGQRASLVSHVLCFTCLSVCLWEKRRNICFYSLVEAFINIYLPNITVSTVCVRLKVNVSECMHPDLIGQRRCGFQLIVISAGTRALFFQRFLAVVKAH